MIEYILEKNELAKGQNKFTAQVVNSRSHSFDAIADHLLKHQTGLSSSVIYGVWEGIKNAVEEIVSDGGSIKTELFYVRPVIRGVFNGKDDGFDKSRHAIRLNMQSGAFIRKVPEKLSVRKSVSAAKAFINSVTDIKSGAVDTRLTPGKSVRIMGQRVKILGTDPSCGLYFIPADKSAAAVKVEASDMVVNNPSELIVVIPQLKKGTWSLRLVTQFSSGGTYLKKPRGITFDKDLVVA